MRAQDWRAGSALVHDQATQRSVKLQALVAGLEVLNDPDAELNKPGSEDLAPALHEEDSRGVVLWAVLRPFLYAYAKAFPLTTIPSESKIAGNVEIMLDEGLFFLTQQLIKRHLRREGPMSLGQLAEYRYRRGSTRWERFQRKLAREVFQHASDLQIWKIETIGRVENENGGGAIAGYKVSAGQALIDFDEFVFQPRRQEHYRRFCERYLRASRRT